MAFTVSDPQQLRDRVAQWPAIRARLESARAAAAPVEVDSDWGLFVGWWLSGAQDSTWDRISGYLDGFTRIGAPSGPWPVAPDAPDERPPTPELIEALEADTDTAPLRVVQLQVRRAQWPWVGLWVTAGRSAEHWSTTKHRARARDWAQHRDAIAGRAIDTWNSWELIWADQMQAWEDASLANIDIHAHERPLPSWH